MTHVLWVPLPQANRLVRRWPPGLMAALVFLALTFAVFSEALFGGRPVVLGNAQNDMALHTIASRQFAFGELRRGNLPLWNPHLYGGTPSFIGVQSALLYPPNWLHLVLPLGPAINWNIALHVVLAGLFTYLWCATRGVSGAGSILAGMMFMFSGPYFLQIYAGHPPQICVAPWAPVLLLAIDGLLRQWSVRWCLLGAMAVAMQILGGQPQYAYYIALAAGVYFALNLIRTPHRLRAVAGFVGLYLGGAALAAVQLLTGWQAAREYSRSGGVPYAFASMFSLPPENLLTLLAPDVLGGLTPRGSFAPAPLPYFGRWYLWEASLFVSVTGLVLAMYGAVRGNRSRRRFSVTMVGLLIVLALGAHTPLFRVLYQLLPGYSSFRGTSKFAVLACLFLAMLAGIGFDQLRATIGRPGIVAGIAAGAGASVGGLAAWLSYTGPSNRWGRLLLDTIAGSRVSFAPPQWFEDPDFLRDAISLGSEQLLISAATLLIVSALLFRMRLSGKFAYGLIVLAGMEMFLFARGNTDTMRVELDYPAAWRQALQASPGDYRVLHLHPRFANAGMSLGFDDLWGYDPGVLRRYGEFMAATQGVNPDLAARMQYSTLYLTFRGVPKIYSMLRLRYVFPRGGKVPPIPMAEAMPHLQLISDFAVIPQRDEIFRAIGAADFDPRQKVILESAPRPAPERSTPSGTARLVGAATDELEIVADLPHAAILLVTDNYSSGWRVVPLAEGPQERYEVMPANYVLRAIPLAAGRHHFLLQYAPLGFRIGRWISLVALVAYVGLWLSCGRPPARPAADERIETVATS